MRTVLADQALLSRVLAGNSVIFAAEEEKFFGGARRLGRPGQPAWAIGIIIPVDDVMAAVYRNDRRAFWTGLACLALTAVIAVGISRRVAEPLRLLTHEARAIGRLELEEENVTVSNVAELATLATSMSEMKSSLRSFQKFVPAEVVKEIVTSATEARLGGKRATLTLLFSDVKDFTTMAERMSPEALVALVGEYLGEMSEVILGGGGTVDKFIGDGIMAFWGAPRANAQHARDACRGALQCQRALTRRRERWLKAGQPALHTRIALHTGAVIVGNIGSEKRLNYTALGDGVNLTSRIEGLNKFYGTEILISAACAEAAGDAIVTRPVDHVSVKGRSEGLVVHELLAWAGEAEEWALRAASLTATAFAAYLRGDFHQAHENYQALLVLRADDPVATLMEKRCVDYMTGPRPTEWDTTFRVKEK
jgi:adenylate cyclase